MGGRRTSTPAVIPSRAGSVNPSGRDGPNGTSGIVSRQVEGGGAGAVDLIIEEQEGEAINEGEDFTVGKRDAKSEEKRMGSGDGGGGGEAATGRNGKRKRFSRLRRAFGLHD